MRKEIYSLIKKEFAYMGILFFIALIIFKIAFYKESILVLLRLILSLSWLFIVPGYFIMLYWHDKIDFSERLVAGIAVSAAIVGVVSYYLGLLGLNIKYHVFLLPVMIILAGAVVSFRKWR